MNNYFDSDLTFGDECGTLGGRDGSCDSGSDLCVQPDEVGIILLQEARELAKAEMNWQIALLNTEVVT